MWLWILWGVWMLAILYLLFFFIKNRGLFQDFQEPKDAFQPKNQPLPEGVSVIICAHNELDNLRKLLPVLYQQNYRRYEIIVVNDRSTDGTLDFLLQEKEQQPKLKVVWVRHRPEHIKGKKYALSLGIRAARYDKLLLTDADCCPVSPDWIRGMSSKLEGKISFVLGYSPYFQEKDLLNTYIRYETLLTAGLYFSAALQGHPYMGVGRNLAYRKSLFMEKKGFYPHLHLAGGDDDLFVNAYAIAENTAISLDKRTHVKSYPKNSWLAYYRQKKRHLSVGRYYHRKDKIWLGALSVAHFIFWLGLICLILIGYEPIFIITGLILKWISQFYFLKTTADKLNEPINWALLPILDFLYVIYYILLGISALSSNNTQWN